MHDYNHSWEAHENQKRLAKKDLEETISELGLLQQEAYRLGNNGGEVSEIGELLKKFKNNEIPKKEALEKAHVIVYKKVAGVDATTGSY
jgi:hypothetical protein